MKIGNKDLFKNKKNLLGLFITLPLCILILTSDTDWLFKINWINILIFVFFLLKTHGTKNNIALTVRWIWAVVSLVLLTAIWISS